MRNDVFVSEFELKNRRSTATVGILLSLVLTLDVFCTHESLTSQCKWHMHRPCTIKSLEGLKVARPLSRKSNLEAKPVISDGHLKFCMTTHNLWMATVKQRSYQQLS